MKDETAKWFKYAEENLLSAEVLLERGLYNPCLLGSALPEFEPDEVVCRKCVGIAARVKKSIMKHL